MDSLGGVYPARSDQISFGDCGDAYLKLKCFGRSGQSVYCVCFWYQFIICGFFVPSSLLF